MRSGGVDKTFQGLGATVQLTKDGVSITRSGVASFLTQGIKGEKRIAFASITAIQLKDAGKHMSGYIQFSILGGNESRGGMWDATTDENTVMFTKDQAASFRALRDIVEERMALARRPQAAATGTSIADELSKLAELRDRGVLSHEEFARQKAATLSS